MRLRLGKGKEEVLDIPFLLATQIDSYQQFLQAHLSSEQRQETGLHGAFKCVFPIISYSGHAQIEYVNYSLGEPLFDVQECQLRGATYAAPLRVKMRLVVYDKEKSLENPVIRDIKEQEVFMGEIPLMTDIGTFVINGTEGWWFPNYIVLLVFFLSMIKVKPILQEIVVFCSCYSLSWFLVRF